MTVAAWRVEWEDVVAPPPLANGEVHVWRLALALERDTVARLAALLPAHEREELARTSDHALREWRTAARGLRRVLLARYADEPPARLRFGTERLGRPRLLGAGALTFSASRAGSAALLAVSRGIALGVDVQASLAPTREWRTWWWWLAPEERRRLAALGDIERAAEATRSWAGLEARAKLHGAGVAGTRDAPPDGPCALLLTFVPDDGPSAAAGALACAARPRAVRWLRGGALPAG